MTAIGFRAYSNTTVYYCILDKNDDSINLLNISEIKIPQSLGLPEALNYIRNTVLDILIEYDIKRAVIRLAEFGRTANRLSIERTYIEGVLQEVIADSMVEKHLAGRIGSFNKVAGFGAKAFKEMAKGEREFENIPDGLDWKGYSLEVRESILSAYTALNL